MLCFHLILQTDNPWYTTSVWIVVLLPIVGVIVSCVGVYFSIIASQEATKAKEAAYGAGHTVKTQEIIMELERIVHACELDAETKFFEVNNKFNEITGRIYAVIGILIKDNEVKEQVQLLQDSITAIKPIIESINPSSTTNIIDQVSEDNKKTIVYCIISPHFSTLIQNISLLKGILSMRLMPKTSKENG